MSRLYRPIQTLLGPARILSRVPGGQTVRIERVRLKKGKPAARFLGTVIKGTLIFNLVLLAIPPAAHGETHHEEEEESVFIPFPFTTKRNHPQPYSGRDPEWKEFVRISTDKNQLNEIRRHVADLVLDTVSHHPTFIAKAGRPFSLRRCWLDIHFPLVAPPVYERSGILVTDEALEWVTVESDSYSARLLDRVLWPRPLAMSFWALGTEAVRETAHEVAKYFGLGSEESASTREGSKTSPPLPTTPSPEVQKALERLRQQATRRPEEIDDPGSRSSSGGVPSAGPSASRDRGAGNAPDKQATDQGSQENPSQRGWVTGLLVSFAKSKPWKKFKETFIQEFKPLRPDPPRGSVLVTGLVELETPRAYMSLDVIAWYNPKTRAHNPGTFRLFVRLIQPKKQGPLR